MANIIKKIIDKTLEVAYSAGYTVNMFLKTMCKLHRIPHRFRAILEQCYICGVQSLPVTLVVGIFTGMILSFQVGIIFKEYHLEDYLGLVVLVSMCKEIGPFMTAFLLAGRIGSAMAAELGTMKVSEEVDALEVMSIDPIDYLVLPRITAMALISPILIAYSNFVGVIGGAVVSQYQVGVDYSVYFRNVINYMSVTDLTLIYGGLFKGIIFGIVIATVGCACGLRATNGAEGVGIATRKTVVQAFLLILIFNYYMSVLLKNYLVRH